MENKIIKVNIPQDYKNMWVIDMKTFRDIINSKNITAEIESDDLYIWHIGDFAPITKSYVSTQTLNEDTIILHLIDFLMNLIQGYHFIENNCNDIGDFADEFGYMWYEDMDEIDRIDTENAYEQALKQNKRIKKLFTKEELDKLYDCFFEISE